MSLLILFLIALFPDEAYSQAPTWLTIDCGADRPYTDYNSLIKWQNDDSFINTGNNAQVRVITNILTEQMNTLRFFPDQNKNCYTLPASKAFKYQVRATFFYGNYDGNNTPPTFDLSLDGNSWATVDTSVTSDPFYKEAIVVAKGSSISVCVSRTREGEVPFMSTLDMVHLSSSMYSNMESNQALFTVIRLYYGSLTNKPVWYPQDTYSRIWSVADENNYSGTIAGPPSNTVDDAPPQDVLLTAIKAQSAADDLALSLDISKSRSSSYYVNLYFNVPEEYLLGSWSFNIYLDGEDSNLTVSTKFMECDEYTLITNPISGSMKLDFVPSSNSTYPPFVNALELFEASPDLGNGTNEDDLKGLKQLASSFERLRSWTGDPCLPINTTWEWLQCNDEVLPRVTALYLGGYDLHGELPDFSQMQALQIIDLHNNSLTGPIPDFLGKLPHLTELNIANNDFSGNLPDSIANNKGITVNITGNTADMGQHKSNTALIVGLSVGGACLLLLLCLLLLFVLYRIKRKKQEETTVEDGNIQGTEAAQVGTVKFEDGGDPIPDGNSENISMDELHRQMETELGNLIHEHMQMGNRSLH